MHGDYLIGDDLEIDFPLNIVVETDDEIMDNLIPIRINKLKELIGLPVFRHYVNVFLGKYSKYNQETLIQLLGISKETFNTAYNVRGHTYGTNHLRRRANREAILSQAQIET